MQSFTWISILSLAVLNLCSGIKAEKYLIVSPRVFRNGTTSTLSVTFYELKEDVTLDLTITRGTGTRQKTIVSTSTEFKSWDAGKGREIELPIPSDAPSGTAKLEARATAKSNRKIFQESKSVSIQSDATQLFIQSDKAIYKPGETVKFRVIAVKPDLKPGDGKLTEVYVKNPTSTRMIQWKNVDLDTGFATFAMKLAKKPLLGNWIIEAKYDGKTVSKGIKVDKYVLPKIEVEIKAPGSLLYKRMNFEVTVCARYTYGKAARGKATATFCLERRYRYWGRSQKKIPCIQIVKKIFGCEDFQVRYRELGDLSYLYGFLVRTNVSFEEEGTNLKFKAEHNITKISYHDTKLSFDGTPSYFKPGFPFRGQLKVTDNDDRPAEGSRKVKITARSQNGVIFDDYSVVKNGLLKFDIETDNSMKYISLQAKYVAESRKNVPQYYRTSQTSKRILSWYSRSNNFILIEAQKAPFKIGKSATIYVKGTGDSIPDNTVTYQVLCRGDTVLTGTYKVVFTDKKKFQGKISFPATSAMVPKCRLLTYYVRGDGEFISDFALINFEESFENKVSVQFSEAQKKPGEQVTLKINAYPGSRFALAAIDKSVQLLAKNNDLKSADIMSILERQDIGPGGGYGSTWGRSKCQPSRPRWHRSVIFPPFGRNDHVDGSQALQDSGVVFFSNLAIDVKPCPRPTRPRPFFHGTSEEIDDDRDGSPDLAPESIPMAKRKENNVILNKEKAQPNAVEAPRVRKNFPETWLWAEDFVKCRQDNMRQSLTNRLASFFPKDFQTLGSVPVLRKFNSIAKSLPGANGPRPRPRPRPVQTVRPVVRRPNEADKKNKEESVRVRTEFPETWIWTDDYVNNQTGNKVVTATVPDTLTTWFANAFATSPSAGIGIAQTSSLLVFQPFFVSLALPYSVIRGEKVEIPATVFNYLESCLPIKLELQQSDKYQIVGKDVLSICVCSDKPVTARFKIVASQLNKVDITVKATTVSDDICGSNKVAVLAAADAVSKKLLVEAEGIKKESTYNSYFCLQDEKDKHKQTIALSLPDRYVPGSVYATFSVFGDLMGPSLTNLDNLLAMPYGCGEQNMLNFAPSIYVLDYLTNSKQLTPTVKSRAIEYMLAGYQRELTYKRKDGSYSAFGDRDKEGSTWLTAFVLRCFGQARRYISIDDRDILVSRKWLLSQQNSDGCFKDVGMVHHREMKGGIKSGVTMTAFVLVALLETGLGKTDRDVSRALQCITKDLASVEDDYTASILAYTLTLAGSQAESTIMTILKKMAKSSDGMTHWEGKTKSEEPTHPWYMYRQARSADIEMTAYAMMAYLKTENYVDTIPIIRWLARQRNSLGGFSSTQDTCVALQALSQSANRATAKGQDLSLTMNAPDLVHTFKVTEDNKLVLQRVELPKVPANVSVEASGVGCALIQTNVKFNEEKEKILPAFTIEVNVRRAGIISCSNRINICTRYNKGTSNMALVDVQMVSGFEPITEDLDQILQSTENVVLKDYEFIGNKLSLYFNEIGSENVCISFGVEEKQRVEDRKPAPVKVYDYYDTSKSATVMHSVDACKEN